jgi:effector-binding domain-containing protein
MAIALIAGAAIVLTALLWGRVASNVEQARYTVLKTEKNIEVRDYAPMIVAQATTQGSRDAAINEGFRRIADYIFGNNTSQNKIAMTAPVTQTTSEKIAMTAPVTQQGDKDEWVVRFVMPYQYSMKTLPKPNNANVKLKEIPGTRFAVIRFSGRVTEENLESHERELKAFMKEKGLRSASAPTYAFFNPPWTLPLLKRNEIMMQLTD